MRVHNSSFSAGKNGLLLWGGLGGGQGIFAEAMTLCAVTPLEKALTFGS